MSTFNMLISEIAHSMQQADSVPVRRAIKLNIIHVRNQLIRQSYDQHRFVDKGLQQRFNVNIIDVPDSDTVISKDLPVGRIKRSLNKIPRPVRLNINLPFNSVRTLGIEKPMEIAFVKEVSSNYYKSLPGFCNTATYDFINEYLYIDTINFKSLKNIKFVVIEAAFEYPHIIKVETHEGVLDIDSVNDDDEFLLPEDMIPNLKSMVIQIMNPQVVRQTNEVPTPNLVK